MEQLLRLLAEHQDDLFRYVFSLLPNSEDVKDILQETYVALTRKFGEYDPAKPFLPWAYGFAYMQVLKHRDARRPHQLIERLENMLGCVRIEIAGRLVRQQ